MIQLKNISKHFLGHEVLHNIHLDIPQGDILGIIGGSGAGKSTLLRCINLLERPDAGEVWVNGQNLWALSPKNRRTARRQMGMIFQHYQLLNQQSVLDNICLPMRIQHLNPRDIQIQAYRLLDIVGLSDKAHSYPSQLSGGQKQRVAIARALSTNPSILLCDEATAALDPSNTQAILNLLVDIQKQYGMTLVLITHDMQVAKKICHRLVLMQKGKIVETAHWPSVLKTTDSTIRQTLYGDSKAQLPEYIYNQLQETPSTHVILRVLFPGQEATIPFISQMCRQLNTHINILSAQIEHSHQQQCGMMLLSMETKDASLKTFLEHCEAQNIIGDIIGYVEHIKS